MVRLFALFILGFCVIASADSQQSPNYTQYTANRVMLNPAFAGFDGATNITMVAREQWLGVKGTPKIHAITIDSRILGDSYISKKIKIRKKETRKTTSGNNGWAANLYSDINGPIVKSGVSGTYSYHIELDDSQLSFGISLLFFQLKIKESDFILSDDELDDLLTGSNQSIWNTDASFGIYFGAKDYYAGYSTVQLLNSAVQFGRSGEGDYKLVRQHTLLGGYKYSVNNILLIEPAMLLKVAEKSATQLDISAKCIYDFQYWAGLNFRTGSSLSLFGGIKIDMYNIGYAIDYNFNTLMQRTYASHEFIVSVQFDNAARRFKWLKTY